MTITTESRLGDIALNLPAAMRVFERHGLDYCCGGKQTLAEASARADIEPASLIGELEALQQEAPRTPDQHTWMERPLTELIGHIESRHHVFTREELARIEPLMARVLKAHGARHPELERLALCVQELGGDLLHHLQKEEQVLFPYIRNLESGSGAGEACFATVRGPISVMVAEHDNAGAILREIHALTRGHVPPPDACASYKSLLMGLKALEEDLHEHIHLENHLLFPRAVELEERG